MPASQRSTHCSCINAQGIYTIVVLCYVNLVNYMDRFGVLAVLSSVQDHFNVDKNLILMLPTGFIFCYMLIGLLFGYLGDRFSRFVVLLAVICVWWMAALLGTFYLYDYWLFLTCRLFVAIGEAGFSAVSLSVLADTLSGRDDWCRTVALACYFAAIPVGSGVGFLISAKLTQYTGEWWWGIRTIALMGALSTVGACSIQVPIRGNHEGARKDVQPVLVKHAFWDDVISLLTNITYVFTTLSLTTMCYVVGVLAWWLPQYVYRGLQIIEAQPHLSETEVAVWLALILIGSGICGAAIGGLLSGFLRPYFENIDAIICSVGSLLSALLLAATVLQSNETAAATYGLLFCSLLALNMNWPLVGGILLYVTEYTYWCLAAAIQMFVAHGLGGIAGPYIVGILTYERCESECGFAPSAQEFHVLRLALLTVFLVSIIGAAFFLVASYFLVNNRQKSMQILVSNY